MGVLAVVAMIAFAISVGCSQNDRATVTARSGPDVPTITGAEATTTPTGVLEPARPQQILTAGRGFVPLDNPVVLAADEADFLGDDELVLGVEWSGEVRAYPVRMLRYLHVVNDSVGDSPLLVTY